MKRRFITSAAVLAVSALTVTACSPGEPPVTETNNADAGSVTGQQYTAEPTNTGLADLGDVETAAGTISIGLGDNFTSYNSLEASNYSTYNNWVMGRLGESFNYFGTDGVLYPNEEFGSYEVLSEDPLQVRYTIHEDAQWSDGTPVTAGDFLFKWGVQNPNTVDAEGNTVFTPISTTFGQYVSEAPEGDPNGKEFTVTFDEPYADWEIMIDGVLPTHVIAKQVGMSFDELVAAAVANDGEALKEAAEFWNTGWNLTTSLPDQELIPSYGQYLLTDYVPNQSVTLTANPDYWGTPAATETLVFRIADPATHPQALQNADMNVISPQATVDTLNQLKGMGDAVNIHTYPTMTYEHLDFNFGSGTFADSLELRQAFALCVPRERIVENLIKPLNPDAEVLNAREYFNYQEDYKAVTDYSYDGSYDEVDIEKASELIKASGATNLDVRIGYNSPNPRRSDTVALIKESCDQAGFNVIDQGSDSFFSPGGDLESGNYDIALFAWAGSGQIVSGRNITHTEGKQNRTKFSNADVDAAWDIAAGTVDSEVHLEQRREVEKLLWEDLYNIPLYVHPGIAANSANVANIRPTAVQTGIVWNASQWALVSAE